ncbi:hypothetical protein [Desulfoferrobacter suflitae]|uniref:hypothetical protein n=1 Tax=Desulfoferrobacter suflitae TaxID=2865782 RepID=UPI0021643393|nr:hypothetical protein [Desulfoferrobacter suflitae]MCK8600363.1 hypothetical protein [Desulfoferrobacter suflitae]
MMYLMALMLLALLIPIVHSVRCGDIWEQMLCYASVSTKAAVIVIVFSVLRDDSMIGLVAVVALSLGNADLMLLAHLLKRLEDRCD